FLFHPHRSVSLFGDFGGGVEMGFTEVAPGPRFGVGRAGSRSAFGREAGGDVLCALDFLLVTGAFVNRFGGQGGFIADGCGAGLLGFPLLVLAWFGSAPGGTKAHSAPTAAAKMFGFTHS